MTARVDPNGSLLDRIKQTLVGLRMPRALEMIDATVRQLERGELSPLEAIEGLLMGRFFRRVAGHGGTQHCPGERVAAGDRLSEGTSVRIVVLTQSRRRELAPPRMSRWTA